MVTKGARTGERGTSILEVLIALIITGLITTAILKLYVTQHRNYIVQDDITEIQQSARASIDELTRQIRMAGNMLPVGLDPIKAANTNPDTITITYRLDGCDTYLSDPMPLPSAELKCGSDISCFEDSQWVYIFHPDSGGGEWFVLTEVQAAARHLQHNTMDLSRAYTADAIILTMKQIKFYVDNTTDPEHPTLMISIPGESPHVFAENISDLQFRYRLKNGVVVDVPVLTSDIREVIISVTGQSRYPDSESDDNARRTRTYTSSVNLRNLGV